jgi:(2S)-methylsuccinyl-CoA dehydrogenase
VTPELDPALAALDELLRRALGRVRERSNERDQLATHGLAHLQMEVEACRQLVTQATGGDELERRIAGACVGELCRTLVGGVNLGACENVALADMGLADPDVEATLLAPEVRAIAQRHASGDVLVELARDVAARGGAVHRLSDAALEATRTEMQRFAQREIAPLAQRIHRNDELIPLELIARLGQLGVFGMTIPEAFGGSGQSRVAMCVVTEEIARASLGVGSLGTRSEIAGELVLTCGTDEQKRELLPGLASGAILPTAVFSEPDHGSDLAHVRTRAERQPDGSWRLSGQKTWITHATRADLMTVLARTRSDDDGHGGLSMFLARKSRARVGREFVDEGLTGTEIEVLGYRGMKEYELAFDGFRVEAGGLLGGIEGAGFKQLMQTFETARIQTAARAVGVAQAALDEAMRYAQARKQFGQALIELPRIARKLGRAIVRVAAARGLTHFAAGAKDRGRRCDLEAGMAKLLATQVAWETADAAVQIHGGNGYAQEFTVSRLLVDARVLSIFEGTSEIQAEVIARRLLEGARGSDP